LFVLILLTGEPTLQQKAEMFVSALNLGLPAPPPPHQKPAPPPPRQKPAPPSTTRKFQPPPSINVADRKPTNLSLTIGKRGIQKCPSGIHKICTNTYSKP